MGYATGARPMGRARTRDLQDWKVPWDSTRKPAPADRAPPTTFGGTTTRERPMRLPPFRVRWDYPPSGCDALPLFLRPMGLARTRDLQDWKVPWDSTRKPSPADRVSPTTFRGAGRERAWATIRVLLQLRFRKTLPPDPSTPGAALPPHSATRHVASVSSVTAIPHVPRRRHTPLPRTVSTARPRWWSVRMPQPARGVPSACGATQPASVPWDCPLSASHGTSADT